MTGRWNPPPKVSMCSLFRGPCIPPHLSFRTQRSEVRNLKSTFTTKGSNREGMASWIPPYGRNDRPVEPATKGFHVLFVQRPLHTPAPVIPNAAERSEESKVYVHHQGQPSGRHGILDSSLRSECQAGGTRHQRFPCAHFTHPHTAVIYCCADFRRNEAGADV